MPGILMSRKTTSGDSRSMSARPSWPVAATTHSYPAYSKVVRIESRIAASSSMIKMRCFISAVVSGQWVVGSGLGITCHRRL